MKELREAALTFAQASRAAFMAQADRVAEAIQEAREHAKITVDRLLTSRSAKAIAMMLVNRKKPGGRQHPPVFLGERTIHHRVLRRDVKTGARIERKRPVIVKREMRADVAKIIRNEKRRVKMGRPIGGPTIANLYQ